jgi:DUF4097 and DUF4098 domain-containing protein YvlB
MLLHLLTLMSLQAPPAFETDTTLAVPQGTRLRVENQGGDISVKAWDRNQVRVQASHSRRTRVDIRLSGAVLSLEAEAERGPANMVDYEITVPVWMAVDLEGMFAAVSVEGTRAGIQVETLEGDITVKGGADLVKLASVQGRVVVSGARGRIEVSSVSEDIEGSDLSGDIIAESVSGDISLRRIDAKSVEVQTVSGELFFDGRIVAGARYSLLTHSGDIVVTVPEGSNATINTAVGSGDVTASFPLPASDRPGRRRQVFRLGTGSAAVDLETFSGDVELLRPAEMNARFERMTRRREEREARERQKHKPGLHDERDDDHDHLHGGK